MLMAYVHMMIALNYELVINYRYDDFTAEFKMFERTWCRNKWVGGIWAIQYIYT